MRYRRHNVPDRLFVHVLSVTGTSCKTVVSTVRLIYFDYEVRYASFAMVLCKAQDLQRYIAPTQTASFSFLTKVLLKVRRIPCGNAFKASWCIAECVGKKRWKL